MLSRSLFVKRPFAALQNFSLTSRAAYTNFIPTFTETKPLNELYGSVSIPANDPLKDYRLRLLYRSTKNGILENDIILGDFSKKYIVSLTEAQLNQYETLLRENDWDVYKWCVKPEEEANIPEEWKNSEILPLIRQFVSEVRHKS